LAKTRNIIKIVLSIVFAIISTSLIAKTTFAESASVFNLNLSEDIDFRDAISDANLNLRNIVNNSNPNQGYAITFAIPYQQLTSLKKIVVQDILPTDFTLLDDSSANGSTAFNIGTSIVEWKIEIFVLGTTSCVENTIILIYTVRADIFGKFKSQTEITNSSLINTNPTVNNGKL